MRAEKQKRRYGSSGSTLITVLLVFTMFVLLGAAMLTASTVSTRITMAANSRQQADLIAKSAIKSTLSYLNSNKPNVSSIIKGTVAFNDKTDKGKTVNSSIEIDPNPSNSAILKVISTTSYQSVTGKAVAYFTRSSVNQALPTNYLIYASNPGSIVLDGSGNFSSANDVTITGGKNKGTFLIKGNITFSSSNGSYTYGDTLNYANKIAVAATGNVDDEGNQVYGDIIAGGSVTVNQSAGQIYGNIYAGGDVTVYGGATVHGNIYTKGNLLNIGNSDATIYGNVYVGSNIGSSSTGFVDHIKGTAYAQKNAYIGWTPDFANLILGGTWTLPNNATISQFISTNQQPLQNQTIPPFTVNTVAYIPSTTKVVTVPSKTADPALYQPVSISNKTISADGSLDNFDPGNYQGTITIDARNKDINLLLDKNLAFNYNCQGFTTIGSHNVYIWLNTGSSLSLTGCYIGPADTTARPNVYIIGDNQSITFSNASVYGNIYIPNGTFSTTSSNKPYSPSGMSVSNVLFGSMICKSASIGWNFPMTYYTPNFIGTPLENAVTGGSLTINGNDVFYGSGSTASDSNWMISGWASQ